MTTTSNPGGRPIYLMLRMKPPWVFVDEIRRFVESFCACACPGQSLSLLSTLLLKPMLLTRTTFQPR